MAFNTNITPGRPPLLWSEVNDAFVKINENFDSLIAAGLGGGLVPVDFNTLDTDVSPTTDNLRSLGSITNRWKSVYTGEHTLSDPTNGVFLGNAQIKGLGFTVNIPAGSTIGGDPLTGIGTSLIIDPDKTFFKTIQVNNDLSVVATEFGSTLNLLSGSGISLAVNSGSDSIEIDNTGILSVTAGLGITSTTVNGVATVTNIGVRSLQNTTALPLGRSTGTGINITGSTGDNLRITNTGVISVTGGLGITVSVDVATGEFQVTNAAPAQPAFQQIEVNGDSINRLIADGTAGVFRIVSGQGITLAKTVGTDTMTITVDPVFDLKGSIFGDDSTKIVDAVENKVYAEFFGNLTGNVLGNLTGNVTGNASSATVSTTLDITDTNGLTTVYYPTFVENRTTGQTVRADVDLSYRTDTNTLTAPSFSGNLTGTVTGNIFTNLIDSADSSAITVTPATIFNSDVTVENEIVANKIRFSDGSIMTSYRPVTLLSATTVAQTIPDSASASPIVFVETVDTAGAYSGGVFTAPYTGYYQFNVSIYFSTTVTLNSGSFFEIGNLTTSAYSVTAMSGSWTGNYFHYSTVAQATAGDQIAFVIRQVSGATIDVSSGSRLTIHRVSIGA
jgi:hypothetical protein